MEITSNYQSNATINEDIIIKNNAHATLNGVCNGKVTLLDNSELLLKGLHIGDLVVEPFCKCCIRGTHNGNITNKGIVEIHGVVDNCILNGKNIIIYENAVVNGKVYDSDVEL